MTSDGFNQETQRALSDLDHEICWLCSITNQVLSTVADTFRSDDGSRFDLKLELCIDESKSMMPCWSYVPYAYLNRGTNLSVRRIVRAGDISTAEEFDRLLIPVKLRKIAYVFHAQLRDLWLQKIRIEMDGMFFHPSQMVRPVGRIAPLDPYKVDMNDE